MSSIETPNDTIQPIQETPANPAQKQAKRVFIGFAATISIGLALAGWYMGGRIFAAQKTRTVTIAKAVPVAAPVANPAPSPVVVAEPVAAEPIVEPVTVPAEKANPSNTETPAWNTVDPQSGELYLQLAAMGPNSTNDYLKTLDAKGIHPRIAPGPSESLHRILIGPYPDKAALEKEQSELEAAGVQFMARRY